MIPFHPAKAMHRAVSVGLIVFVSAVAAPLRADQAANVDQLKPEQTSGACGQVVTLATREGAETTYSLAGPSNSADAALVLLPGGGGFLDIDTHGCPRRLKGNSLVRTRSLSHSQGLVPALVDAPSDHQGPDGLGAFRTTPEHAEDLGQVIADVRHRTRLPVWLIGTSRGTISAVNAASRLTGLQAPDGLVLTSPVTSGRIGSDKAWVAQTVFSLDLEAIRLPVLAVAHAADKCIRTPPKLAAKITRRTNGVREQHVTVTGGSGWNGPADVIACKGRSPHGFVGQENEVIAGIARFVRGGSY